MLSIVSRLRVEQVRDALLATFTSPGHEVIYRRLTDPSGGTGEVPLYWRPVDGVWGFFSKRPQVKKSRWFCWFGTSPGRPGDILTASIEINLTVNPGNKSAGGRSLQDSQGALYLGHKGLLGGGRGGQMSMAEFAAKIQGFIKEPILRPNYGEESVFVIGSLHGPTFLSRLRNYVTECERLRAFARARSQQNGRPDSDCSPSDQREAFSQENELDGTGGGHPRNPYLIRRVHGRVVNALQKKIGATAVNGTRSEMRPDLYILTSDGRMRTLFEVKASSDTQSWFTALGQLVVYGASEDPLPQRVLVCPAPRQDPSFKDALSTLGVAVVTFKEEKGGIRFRGLEPFLS